MTSDRPEQSTPLSWRLTLGAIVLALTGATYLFRETIGSRGAAMAGVVVFILLTAALSANLRAVSWRTVGMGFVIQVLLALFVLKFQVGESKPGFEFFQAVGRGVEKFIGFTDAGTTVVFGKLAEKEKMKEVLGKDDPPAVKSTTSYVPFAFSALATIIFFASFFSVLYYLGILQLIVQILSRLMMYLMGTSGAETLSATANVFMGQTEAPLIIKPYLSKMTDSELLAVMAGGMATISGGMMAVYISLGADAVAILVTSVMAAPCGLYLSKLMLPETGEPLTRGTARIEVKSPHRNIIDAASAGASDGLQLALNVAAMLIAFLALLAALNYGLSLIHKDLTLFRIFGVVMYPLALLMGVETADLPKVADLLGVKLAANEFVAFLELTKPGSALALPPGSRSFVLTTFALTGFANFASIGIQLGGIGVMAPERRPDLARLGMRALYVGFTATILNAAMVGILL